MQSPLSIQHMQEYLRGKRLISYPHVCRARREAVLRQATEGPNADGTYTGGEQLHRLPAGLPARAHHRQREGHRHARAPARLHQRPHVRQVRVMGDWHPLLAPAPQSLSGCHAGGAAARCWPDCRKKWYHAGVCMHRWPVPQSLSGCHADCAAQHADLTAAWKGVVQVFACKRPAALWL